LKPEVLKPDVLKPDILWVLSYCLGALPARGRWERAACPCEELAGGREGGGAQLELLQHGELYGGEMDAFSIELHHIITNKTMCS
jgi:hypothetical protein